VDPRGGAWEVVRARTTKANATDGGVGTRLMPQQPHRDRRRRVGQRISDPGHAVLRRGRRAVVGVQHAARALFAGCPPGAC